MIILITGNMGTGKTSYVIDAIANNKDVNGSLNLTPLGIHSAIRI